MMEWDIPIKDQKEVFKEKNSYSALPLIHLGRCMYQ